MNTTAAPVQIPSAYATPTPAQPRDHALVAQGAPWWKGVLAILSLAVIFLVANTALTMVGLFGGRALGFTELMNPLTFLALNLSWAIMIPVAPAIMRAFFHSPRGNVGSADGGLRWRRLARALVWVVPLYGAFTLLMPFIGPKVDGGPITPALIGIALVSAFTTPLQAAGEEFLFRGAINQAAATWGRTRRAGLVVGCLFSSIVFGLAHGATDPWLAAYYLAFGLAMWAMTYLSRGLEVAIAVHAVNNVFSFAAAVTMGADPDAMFDRSAGHGGPFVLAAIAVAAIAVTLTWALERRPRRANAEILPAGRMTR